MKSIWSEVRTQYVEDDITYVDAWVSDDADEGGHVIAAINNSTLEIAYIDERAKTDEKAQEYITQVIEELKIKHSLIKNDDYEINRMIKASFDDDEIDNITYNNQELIDDVIEMLKEDISNGDYTVLDELLHFIPNENLIKSLPEEQWKKYKL